MRLQTKTDIVAPLFLGLGYVDNINVMVNTGTSNLVLWYKATGATVSKTNATWTITLSYTGIIDIAPEDRSGYSQMIIKPGDNVVIKKAVGNGAYVPEVIPDYMDPVALAGISQGIMTAILDAKTYWLSVLQFISTGLVSIPGIVGATAKVDVTQDSIDNIAEAVGDSGVGDTTPIWPL